MPAGQDFAKKGESNLSDEWLKVTGDSMIVKIESCPDAWSDGQFNSSLVKEIAKYEVKPIDDSEKDIKDWDEDLRRELAEWKAGSFRIRWYCHTHQSRKRSKCLDFKPRPGMKLKRPCDGEYRKERSGRRSLIPRGIFRQSIRELKEEKNSLPESEKWNCWNCGIGKTRSKRSWEGEGRGERVNNAQLALQFTQAHETVVDTRIHRPNPLQDMPSGWIPPPPLEDWSPALARGICQVCEKTARTLDEIFDFLDPEQEHAPTVEKTLWGLSNLGLIYHSKSDVYQFTGDSDILFQKPVAGEVLE